MISPFIHIFFKNGSLFLLFFLVSSALWAASPYLVWEPLPPSLTRGSTFTFKGHLRLPSHAMKKGLHLSIYLIDKEKKKRKIYLLAQFALHSSSFRFPLSIPDNLPPHQYEMKILLWENRKKTIGKNQNLLKEKKKKFAKFYQMLQQGWGMKLPAHRRKKRLAMLPAYHASRSSSSLKKKIQSQRKNPKSTLKKFQKEGLPLMFPSSFQKAKKLAAPDKNKGQFLTHLPHLKLDLETSGGHIYFRQVFEPYLPSHQRITVLDKVLTNFRFTLRDPRKRILHVGGERTFQRRHFIGRIRLLLLPNHWTPLPSVAPDARILWYRTIPQLTLTFAKNGADAMFVQSKKITQPTEIFLHFATDADPFYFGGALPKKVYSHHYGKHPFVLPFLVKRRLRRLLPLLALRRFMPLDQILKKIVPFLRSFTPRPLRPHERKRNLYETLIKARVGVCRHRALLFTLILQYLGFPARFVANGAHAFVEVAFPDGRWRLIDLGGGDIPDWLGKWRGRPFREPPDSFQQPPSSLRAQKQIQLLQKRKNSNWSVPHKRGLSASLKSRILRSEWLSAIRRLKKLNARSQTSPFLSHAPLYRDKK